MFAKKIHSGGDKKFNRTEKEKALEKILNGSPKKEKQYKFAISKKPIKATVNPALILSLTELIRDFSSFLALPLSPYYPPPHHRNDPE